ncbi:hypothetical protein [Arthrobacter sedimenti]|uniref:hypothetical protein n=1 Tax=Arthrobacter sedimenti TaxID=2694931 RepID=UPI001423D3FD|nr:hypothetical protein [Arthrobacter sedimenti]
MIVFIGTLLPFTDGRVLYANFWNSVPLFFIGIGILLPVIALALLAGRRLGSTGLRVGSLSVDQFARSPRSSRRRSSSSRPSPRSIQGHCWR